MRRQTSVSFRRILFFEGAGGLFVRSVLIERDKVGAQRLRTAAEQHHRQTADIIDSADNIHRGGVFFFLCISLYLFGETLTRPSPLNTHIHECAHTHKPKHKQTDKRRINFP